MSSINDIKTDEQYVKFNQVLATISKKISLDDLLDEARLIHKNRPARDLYKSKLEPTTIFQAAAHDVNARSRLVEVRAQVYRQQRVLNNAMVKLRTYLSTQYSSAIKLKASTQQDRKMLLDRILAKAIVLNDEFESTLEQLDLYLKDIDQSGFAIRNITEVLRLLMAPNKSGLTEV